MTVAKFALAFTLCRYVLKTVKNVTVAKFELAFTLCRYVLKTVKNVTVAKFELAFTLCRYILKTVKNVTVAKFELAFTRCRNNSKTVRHLTVKTHCKTLMPRKCSYTLRIAHYCSKSVQKVLFSSLSSVSKMPFSKHAGKSSVFKIYRFQNLAAKMCRFRLSFFTVFKMCRHRVNAI